MAASIGDLFIKIGADLSELKNGLGESESLVSHTANALGGLGKAVAVGALAGFTALAGGIAYSVKAAADAEKVQSQLAAVLKSTGGAAGMTAESVNALATSLSQVTPYEDDAITGAENLLLTFTNIKSNIFPQATEATLNLSAALGQDLQSSAIQVGKALNDPITGATALRRVGVSLTEQQMAQIKAFQESGNLLGAQKIILKELETEFGGAAKAAGQTFGGQLQILQNNLGNVAESIGGAFLPALTQVAEGINAFISSPAVQAGIQQFATGLVAALGQVGTFITTVVVPALMQFAQWIGANLLPALAQAGTFIQMNVVPALSSIGVAIQNLFSGAGTGGGNPLAGFISDLLGALQSALPFIQGLVSGLMENLSAFISWIQSALAPALLTAFTQISEAAMPTLQQLALWVQSTLLPAFQQLGNVVGPLLQAALKGIGDFIIAFLLPALTQLGTWIFAKGLPALGQLAAFLSTALNEALHKTQSIWSALTDAFASAAKFIDEARHSLSAIAETLVGQVASAFEWFKTNILDPFQHALAGLAAYIDKILGMLAKLAGAMGGVFGNALQPTLPGFAAGGYLGEGEVGIVGERGAELAVGGRGGTRIVPLSRSSTNGGGVTVNLTYAPLVSLLDRAEADTQLKPFVLSALREAGVSA